LVDIHRKKTEENNNDAWEGSFLEVKLTLQQKPGLRVYIQCIWGAYYIFNCLHFYCDALDYIEHTLFFFLFILNIHRCWLYTLSLLFLILFFFFCFTFHSWHMGAWSSFCWRRLYLSWLVHVSVFEGEPDLLAVDVRYRSADSYIRQVVIMKPQLIPQLLLLCLHVILRRDVLIVLTWIYTNKNPLFLAGHGTEQPRNNGSTHHVQASE